MPYTYTLADQAVNSGLPMNSRCTSTIPASRGLLQSRRVPLRPRRFGGPGDHPGTGEHESVWFPPGQWTDWFTGATFIGPSAQNLTVPLDRMPVFVKDGGIVPEQAAMDHVGADPSAPTILRVYPGAQARFSLYQDAGTGNGYEHGQDSHTQITTSSSGDGRRRT